jgi:hypothetical protein
MAVPAAVSGRRFALDAVRDPAALRAQLMALAGVREAIVSVEEGAAYLTVIPELWDEVATLNVVKGASGSLS